MPVSRIAEAVVDRASRSADVVHGIVGLLQAAMTCPVVA